MSECKIKSEVGIYCESDRESAHVVDYFKQYFCNESKLWGNGQNCWYYHTKGIIHVSDTILNNTMPYAEFVIIINEQEVINNYSIF